jgi:hypothetical protein
LSSSTRARFAFDAFGMMSLSDARRLPFNDDDDDDDSELAAFFPSSLLSSSLSLILMIFDSGMVVFLDELVMIVVIDIGLVDFFDFLLASCSASYFLKYSLAAV